MAATGDDTIDQLFARDGERDDVNCGVGADSAVVDQLDIASTDFQFGCRADPTRVHRSRRRSWWTAVVVAGAPVAAKAPGVVAARSRR